MIDTRHISDGGHGWLRVDRATYDRSGVQASTYSYQDDDYVYLEEDCDAPAFLDSCHPRPWTTWHVKLSGMCWIRDLDRITAKEVK